VRISRKQLWMGIATLAAQRSTCYRGNIGAVIVHDNNPIAIGYNGPPSGDDHCHGTTCARKTDGGCLRSVHAEVNALARVPNVDQVIRGSDMFVTSNPCPDCAAAIIASALIGRVYYQAPYRITQGITELLNAEIQVFRLSPSGYLVNEATGEVSEAT
jgi:dCMP deaminase